VRGEALPGVADPRLAKVAYGAHHARARDELARMLDHAVAGLGHALDLAALRALRKPVRNDDVMDTCESLFLSPLDRVAKVAEGSVLLLPLTLIAFHQEVGREVDQAAMLACKSTD